MPVPCASLGGQKRTPVGELRFLLLRLSESWEKYTSFLHDPGVRWTNNRTQQAIGRIENEVKDNQRLQNTDRHAQRYASIQFKFDIEGYISDGSLRLLPIFIFRPPTLGQTLYCTEIDKTGKIM